MMETTNQVGETGLATNFEHIVGPRRKVTKGANGLVNKLT